MNLEDLKSEIKKDSIVDSTELAKEALKIPQIHGKYLSIHADLKIELQRLKNAYSIMYLRKYKIYTGKASKEELEKWNEEPFELDILKNKVEIFLEGDNTLLKIKDDINMAETKTKMVEEFLKAITNRNFAIKSAIDWNKLVNGIS